MRISFSGLARPTPAKIPRTTRIGNGLASTQLSSVHGKRALDADAVAHLAHGEGLADARALTADHHALEDLHAFLVAFDDANVHLQRVPGRERRNVVADALGIDEISGVHGACAPGPRSGELAG